MLLLALATGPAQAAVKISSVVAAPVNPQAGSHSNFHVHAEFDRTASGNQEHPNSIVLHLPAGLSGNPSSAAACSQAAFAARTCPAAAQVGTSSIAAVSTAAALSVPITASGKIFVLQPNPGELARLGIDLFPDGAAATVSPHAILSQSVVSVRTTTDNGLDSTLTGLPRTADTLAGPADVVLNSLDLTLNGAAANGPFETNPTSCGTNTTSVDVVSYEDPGTVSSGSGSFATTGCDQLAYNPTVSAVISGSTRNGGRPKISTSVLEGPGQAASKRVTLTLPLTIQPDLELINKIQCTLDQQKANACPKTSIVGSATAKTPLLPIPLTGAVYILQTPSGYPSLRLTLAPLGTTVIGTTTLVGQKLTTTFDNLPDTPLSSFELDFFGGKGGITLLGADLCQGAAQIANGEFLGHNGKTKNVRSVIQIVGCKPSASASVTGKGRRLRLSLTAHAAHGARLRSVTFTLPGRVTVAKWHSSQRSFTPKAGTKARRVSSHVVSVTLPRTGAATVSVVVKGGAVHTLSRGSRTVAVRLTDASGTSVTLHVPVRLPLRA